MNTFKVGDKVSVQFLGGYRRHGTITKINWPRRLVSYSIQCDDGMTVAGIYENSLMLIKDNNNKSFIDQVIGGAKLHNNIEGGVKNMEFCGYAVRLLDSDERVFIIDEEGNAKYFCYPSILRNNDLKFELQSEKTTMHSVAARDGLHGRKWFTINISDGALALTKHNWAEYKILDTWYE